jgi:Tfp pilus assembly protein PilV
MKILHTTHKGFTDTRAGFTLIETLFAILIFTASIVSLMMLSGRSLASTAGSSDELTARYLAQEGIEVTRNVRDTNFVANAPIWQ